MSGIAGVFHLDSAAPDRALTSAMAEALEFRGPDGCHIWSGDSVTFVHTLLKTTYEAESERQPATLDGQVWITADARIDAREDLAGELGLPQSALARPDCELILHAYARWGEECVKHLLGDFAFAIWDGHARKLFCARDHFGIKPFYYSQVGFTFIFSNTLDCVRLHPNVSDELNELAIADFLVFDYNQDLATTTFRDIKRLPPAHRMTVTRDGVSVRRYWRLPEGERISYRRTGDYVDHFRTLVEAAVSDRIRTNRAAVMMSGGLDSTSVAAFARKVRPETEIQAFTAVWDWLIPDDERHFAGLAADGLGMNVEYLPCDEFRPYDGFLSAPTPEPLHDMLRGASLEEHRCVASYCRVALTGHGSDAVFSPSPLTSWESIRAIPLAGFAINMGRYALDQRAIPRFRLRSTVLTWLGRSYEDRPEIPAWLNRDLTMRCSIPDRVDAYARARTAPCGLRPLARRALSSQFWPYLFETQQDAGWSGESVEYLNPYFDLRLVGWLLAIPELPYSVDKWLLRMSLRGMLPEAVRTRPKTPLRKDPGLATIQRYGIDTPQRLQFHARFQAFVDPASVPTLTQDVGPERYWVDSKPISLNHWFISQEESICRRKQASLTASSTTRPSCEFTGM